MKNPKSKIFVLASLPPPYNGQNVGTKLIVDIIDNDFDLYLFRSNISWYLTDNASFFDKLWYYSNAFIKYIFLIIKVWFDFFKIKPEVLYIVPSSNLKGFFKDVFIYFPFLLFRKSIICHIRSGSFNVEKAFFRLIYKKRNFHFIFLTNLLFKSSGVIKQFVVIPNFVDPIFETANINIKRDDKIKILFLSNLFISKGIFNVINSFRSFSDNHKFELIICGKGEHGVINEIESLISGFSNIIFLGEVSDRESVKELYNNSDLFILPTTYKIEASPRTIIEAISQFCVPIVTNHAGIPDMVNVSNSYIIDKEKDINQQLINVFSLISNNKDDLLSKKNFARAHYLDYYSYYKIRRDIISYLKSVI